MSDDKETGLAKVSREYARLADGVAFVPRQTPEEQHAMWSRMVAETVRTIVHDRAYFAALSEGLSPTEASLRGNVAVLAVLAERRRR